MKVLFVCTANICRSPTAEAIFNALAKDRGLSCTAESAGTAALEGNPMAPNAITALGEVGIYPKPHRARRVSRELLADSDLVLSMTAQHVATLRRLSRDRPNDIHTLPEYATGTPSVEGISDPYGLTMAAYRNSVRQLYGYIVGLVGQLKR